MGAEQSNGEQREREDRAIAAARELADLHDQFKAKIRDVRLLFEQAHMEPLPSVARLLGGPNSVPSPKAKLIVTPPIKPPPPPDAGQEWIWVALGDLSTVTLALAVLRDKGEPMSASELFPLVLAHDPRTNMGSLMNVGSRLDGSLIERFEGTGASGRKEQKWKLKPDANVPVIKDGWAWGPPGAFQMSEAASHRRSLIKHVLSAAPPQGMMLGEIYRRLRDSDFIRGVAKDSVKGDLEAMEKDGVVTASGAPRRMWQLAPERPVEAVRTLDLW